MVIGGVIYLHDISQVRSTGIALRHLQRFNALRSDVTLDKVVLCTTHWNRVLSEDGMRRKTEMEGFQWKEMVEEGSQVRCFEDNQTSAWDIVSVLLRRASQLREQLGKEIALQIQDEMAVRDKIILETEAGKELLSRLQESFEMQKVAVKLEKQMAREGVFKLDSREAEAQKNMKKLIARIQSLNVPLGHRIKRFLGLTVSCLTVVARRYHSYSQVVNGTTKTTRTCIRVRAGFINSSSQYNV